MLGAVRGGAAVKWLLSAAGLGEKNDRTASACRTPVGLSRCRYFGRLCDNQLNASRPSPPPGEV